MLSEGGRPPIVCLRAGKDHIHYAVRVVWPGPTIGPSQSWEGTRKGKRRRGGAGRQPGGTIFDVWLSAIARTMTSMRPIPCLQRHDQRARSALDAAVIVPITWLCAGLLQSEAITAKTRSHQSRGSLSCNPSPHITHCCQARVGSMRAAPMTATWGTPGDRGEVTIVYVGVS